MLIISLLLKVIFASTFAISGIYHFNSASKLPFHEKHDGLFSHQEIITETIFPFFTLQAQIAEICNTLHKKAETIDLVEGFNKTVTV